MARGRVSASWAGDGDGCDVEGLLRLRLNFLLRDPKRGCPAGRTLSPFCDYSSPSKFPCRTEFGSIACRSKSTRVALGTRPSTFGRQAFTRGFPDPGWPA